MAQSVPPGDIATQPGTKIVFNAPYDDKHTYHIKVTNSSARRIGWAFKTTNMKRLGVDPAAGVLDPKENALIAVSCDAFAYGQEDTNNDRVTIEWTNTPDGAAKQFRREWFQGDGMAQVASCLSLARGTMAPKKFKEPSIFRSADMSLCQLFLQTDAAYQCVTELGEIGMVQFRDLNEEMNTYQRKFVNEVRRCDEMDRKLRFIEEEIVKDNVFITETTDPIRAPQPKDMNDLEARNIHPHEFVATFEKIEEELLEINKNTKGLKDSHVQLWEMNQVIEKVKMMLDAGHNRHHASSVIQEAAHHPGLFDDEGKERGGTELKLVTGVIRRDRVRAFEQFLWRMCKGKVFMRTHDCDGEHDLFDGLEEKSVFILFFSGDQLAQRVNKICLGFHARLYDCPEEPHLRLSMHKQIDERLADLNNVIEKTLEHRKRVITAASNSVYAWKIKVLKIKMVFHTLNMFSIDVTQKCLIAECWIPTNDLDDVRVALRQGTIAAGSLVHPVLNEMEHHETPPTHFTLNKFTQGYQNIVNAYGMADYKELNPAPWCIISFPFLFGVMFGDVGHALIMFSFALMFIIFEKKLEAMKIKDEIFNTFYSGRYIVLLMSMFSFYTGFIYNDIYSKSINIIGSSWATGANNNSCWEWQGLKDSTTGLDYRDWEKTAAKNNQTFEIMLDPIYCYDKETGPYIFGLDPVWNLASNKLTFTNTMKMKSAVILGIMQMTFGLFVSLGNHIYNGSLVDVFFMFIPQMLFLGCIFIYLCVQILVKWIFFPVDAAWVFGRFYPGSNCAPNLLIGLINMFMMTPRTDGFGEFKNTSAPYNIGDDVNLLDFDNDPNCGLAFWYPGESIAEKVLLVVAVVSIPLMLLVKPFYIKWRSVTHL
uniref:V-type proton ATPase subunit a n=1 Tax=Pristionchus pacificus TaxID=54126 RepID=A0A2A6CYN2_PRIPA|eukprot:PDM83206.1 MSP domain-containing protein [Pristionchus pacificus]